MVLTTFTRYRHKSEDIQNENWLQLFARVNSKIFQNPKQKITNKRGIEKCDFIFGARKA